MNLDKFKNAEPAYFRLRFKDPTLKDRLMKLAKAVDKSLTWVIVDACKEYLTKWEVIVEANKKNEGDRNG